MKLKLYNGNDVMYFTNEKGVTVFMEETKVGRKILFTYCPESKVINIKKRDSISYFTCGQLLELVDLSKQLKMAQYEMQMTKSVYRKKDLQKWAERMEKNLEKKIERYKNGK